MPRLRLRQPLYPILIAFLAALQIMEPSRVWMILLVTFTSIFTLATLWVWMLSRNLHLRRETRLGWIQVGGRIEERLTLSNTFLFPAPAIEFIDHSTLPGFKAGRTTSISAGGFDIWSVETICSQRGLFTLGDAQVAATDPFGIYEVIINAVQKTSILVLPRIASLPDFSISPAGALGEGPPRTNAPQKSMHASTVREYEFGDSMKLIHWPTTARMERIFVRLLESAPEGNWWILLDLDKQGMLGEGPDSIEEQGVTLAASLADLGLRSHKSVGLAGNCGEAIWLPPQKGEAQRWAMMQALAMARPGDRSLSAMVEKMHPSLGKHASLLVVTSAVRLDWLKTILPLTRRGIIPTAFLIDPSTFGGESAEGAVSSLEARGIKAHLIPRGMITPLRDLQPFSNTWSWHSTPSGEVMPVQG